MKFLLHSVCGYGSGLAFRLWQEGHDVSLYIKEPAYKPCLGGIVKHVNSLSEGLSEDTIIIFDLNGDGKKADSLRKEGYHVIGGGDFCDLLEFDRSFSMDLCRRSGIPVPPFTQFKKGEIGKAIEFVRSSQKRYVLKIDDNLSHDLTYVAKEAEDMIQELEWIEEKGMMNGDFLLQEFIEGIEISTEVWFQNGKPLPTPNGTIEVKKFMSGNLGPATSCEMSVVWAYGSLDTKIVKETMGKLFPIIEKLRYTGPIDINSIISKKDKKPYFLEFTPRFGYSAIYALAELLNVSLGDFFDQLGRGVLQDVPMLPQISTALTVSIPPYPLDADKPFGEAAFKATRGRRLLNIPEENFWPFDVMKEKDRVMTAGTLGLICYLTARGDSIKEASEKVYEMADEFELGDKQYRIDGADRALEDMPKLAEMGYEVPEGVDDAVRG